VSVVTDVDNVHIVTSGLQYSLLIIKKVLIIMWPKLLVEGHACTTYRVIQGALWSSALCPVQSGWGGVLLWLGGWDNPAMAQYCG